MTETLKIEVGQMWLTGTEATVRILADNAEGDFPFVGQFDARETSLWNAYGVQGILNKDGDMVPCPDGSDNLSCLAPTVDALTAEVRKLREALQDLERFCAFYAMDQLTWEDDELSGHEKSPAFSEKLKAVRAILKGPPA